MTEPEADPKDAPPDRTGETGAAAERAPSDSAPNPIFKRLGVEIPRARLWQQLLSGGVVLAIGYAVFVLLFRDGGLAQPGEGAEASWPILAPAIVAVFLAAVIDPRLTLRALLALPVLALIGLAVLAFASGSWTVVLPVEATRTGMAILAYALIAIAAAVSATRISTLPLAVLLVAVAVVAGAMGLWGFANYIEPLAVINQGQLTPAGPFRYRNTLALLAASSLIPLVRWAAWDSKDPAALLLSAVAGLGLGVSIAVVATSGSDFAWLMAFVLIAIAVLFPERTLGMPRQRALGMVAASFVVAFASWLMFRKVLAGPPPGDVETRSFVMVCLVLVTPVLTWASSLGAARISDRVATRLVQASAALAILTAAALFLVGPLAPGDITQSRQAYYEATINTAVEEPIKGFGAGSYSQASIGEQLGLLGTQTRFAHSIPGEMWVELGIGGLLLSLLLYAGSFLLSWRTRLLSGGTLLIPLVAGFLFSGLIDWSWHMTAMTALWASALGGLIGVRLGRSSADGSSDSAPEELSGSSA